MSRPFTLKLAEPERSVLNMLETSGLFHSRGEAIRSALLKYAADLNLLSRNRLWQNVAALKPRNISPRELKKELEALEDET